MTRQLVPTGGWHGPQRTTHVKVWTRRHLLAVATTAVTASLSGCARTPATAVRLSTARGADPTGRIDSSNAVQRFITAHAGRAIIVDGTFRMENTLLLPSGTRLSGRTKRDGFVFTWSQSDRGGHYIGNSDPENGNHDISLSGLTVAGAGTGLPSGSAPNALALSFRHGSGLYLTGLRVLNSPSIAIAYQGFSTVHIIGNVVDGSGRDGITGWWYTTPMTDVVVASNRISRMGDDAIAINASAPENPNHRQRPSRIQIYDNVIQGHSKNHPDLWGRGILVLGAEDVTIKNNSITDTAAAGILISEDEQAASARFSSRNVEVTGNSIVGSGRVSLLADQPRSGVFCTSSSRVTVTGNTVSGSDEHGVLLADTTGVIVTRNTFSANGTSCTRDAAHAGLTALRTPQARIEANTSRANASNGVKTEDSTGVRLTDNRCADNGRLGDSRTPLSAGIWVIDAPSAVITGNVCTEDGISANGGRQSWGIIAPALAEESSSNRESNRSSGAVVDQIYTGIGTQAGIDLWNPRT